MSASHNDQFSAEFLKFSSKYAYRVPNSSLSERTANRTLIKNKFQLYNLLLLEIC